MLHLGKLGRTEGHPDPCVLEGKQQTARQRTGKRYARQGDSICRGAEKEEEWHVRGTQTAH